MPEGPAIPPSEVAELKSESAADLKLECPADLTLESGAELRRNPHPSVKYQTPSRCAGNPVISNLPWRSSAHKRGLGQAFTS